MYQLKNSCSEAPCVWCWMTLCVWDAAAEPGHTPLCGFKQLVHCQNMADKPNMTEITSFDKTKLRKTETQEKNPLPTKETIEQERQGESTP
ncbi:Thymosin beta [Labeo rohita]|uniref:Thymosin beta n=1 Tax=Labeo rohita TaxID=84645 RepID=A0ABQ8LKY3_LABRO|nr:Thymosin beta [Labeo rohita]